MHHKIQKFVLLCTAAGLLGSCTLPQQVAAVGYNVYNKMNQDSELLQRSYAAADYLAGQTLASIDKKMLIIPTSLTHAENTGMSSPFGFIVVEQIASRFAQLGYNVRAPEDGPRTFNPDKIDKGVTLTGTYLPFGYVLTNGEVKISLRMVDNSDNRVLGAFDYTMPMTYEMSRLLDDQPTVYRLPTVNE